MKLYTYKQPVEAYQGNIPVYQEAQPSHWSQPEQGDKLAILINPNSDIDYLINRLGIEVLSE